MTDRWDILVMAAMTLVYLMVALYDLGSFKVPSTAWQPLQAGASFEIDFGRDIDISRIYYYSGINENRYDNAKFLILYRTGDSYLPLADIEKKECGIWRYSELTVRTSRLRVVADPPGGTLNEIAIIERGSRTPLRNFRVISDGSAGAGSPLNLFDEPETLEYVPSFRSGFYFDELYHARTAYEYLHGMEPYETTHPPLGKLLIAAGIALFGMNSIGWRLPGVLFGAAMLPIMYLFGKKLFGARFYAFCAAFLMMVDFMHFTHSRLAVIDVYPTVFVMLMFYYLCDFYLQDVSDDPEQCVVPLFLTGLCFGLGAASKWISLYAGVGLALLVALHMHRTVKAAPHDEAAGDHQRSYLLRVSGYCLLFLLVMPAALYLLSYMPFFIRGPGHDLSEVLRNQRDMFAYHSQLKAIHPFSSPWWTWPLDIRPVWLYTGSDLPPGQVSTIASFGNPVIWWAGIPAVIIAAVLAAVERDRGMTVVFTGMACQYLPWAVIPRLAFIYHFFSVVPFVILSQVYLMKKAIETWPRARYAVYGYLGLAGLLFVLFYPLLSGMQTPETSIARLRWLKSWNF
ncbi:hypothetical protein GSbR_09890 [Geobacter sp. SVR]|nr:hypothetical protein GSVR_13120 [Geobacter sp. SVR]GCF84389.1 hypothetical protein GSbR_09890 [Geobacter sp. SVR]